MAKKYIHHKQSNLKKDKLGKIFAMHIEKRTISLMYKQQDINKKRPRTQSKEKAKDEQTPNKKTNTKIIKHIKRCLASLIIRKRQTESTVRYHLLPIQLAKIQSLKKRYFVEAGSKRALSYIANGSSQ